MILRLRKPSVFQYLTEMKLYAGTFVLDFIGILSPPLSYRCYILKSYLVVAFVLSTLTSFQITHY